MVIQLQARQHVWVPLAHAPGGRRLAGGRERRPGDRDLPRSLPRQPPPRSLVAAAVPYSSEEASTSSSSSDAAVSSDTWAQGVAVAKQRLLAAVAGTQRGAEATLMQRGEVEEAQVGLESLSPPEIDWGLLEGTWRLLYTTAPDVLPLVRPQLLLGPLPLPFQAGAIYQRFSSLEEGVVQNIIEVESLPLPLLEGSSAALVVEAGYEQRTAHSIALAFRQAVLEGVQLGLGLQNLVATPLLPRGMIQMQVLQAVQQLTVRIPLAPRLPGTSSSTPRPRGLNYLLTYLDEDTLVGRAQGSGGSFIFSREALAAMGQ